MSRALRITTEPSVGGVLGVVGTANRGAAEPGKDVASCRPPVAWDHFEVSSASVMGPPVRQ